MDDAIEILLRSRYRVVEEVLEATDSVWVETVWDISFLTGGNFTCISCMLQDLLRSASLQNERCSNWSTTRIQKGRRLSAAPGWTTTTELLGSPLWWLPSGAGEGDLSMLWNLKYLRLLRPLARHSMTNKFESLKRVSLPTHTHLTRTGSKQTDP